MNVSLTGRAAVITGGSKGLGLAMAQRFASSGADVAIVARGREALDRAAEAIGGQGGGKVVAIAADVGRADEVERAYGEAMAVLGRVDIVVNNAGTSATGAFEAATDAIWQQDFDLKLFAAIRLTRLVWPQMKERRWGRIINVLNVGAKAPRAGSAPTSVTRAAGMALTKVLANEGGPHNILVNALLVGIIDSDQHAQAAARRGVPTEEHLQRLTEGTPLGRAGRAEEFADLACFLASENASYVTGTAINVDGGRSPVV